MTNEVENIVYDANGTRYEILVSYINDKDSDYYKQYVITLVNFGECYNDTELGHIGNTILSNSKTLGGLDAKNIQNAIAERFPHNVRKVDFDFVSRTLNFAV